MKKTVKRIQVIWQSLNKTYQYTIGALLLVLALEVLYILFVLLAATAKYWIPAGLVSLIFAGVVLHIVQGKREERLALLKQQQDERIKLICNILYRFIGAYPNLPVPLQPLPSVLGVKHQISINVYPGNVTEVLVQLYKTTPGIYGIQACDTVQTLLQQYALSYLEERAIVLPSFERRHPPVFIAAPDEFEALVSFPIIFSDTEAAADYIDCLIDTERILSRRIDATDGEF